MEIKIMELAHLILMGLTTVFVGTLTVTLLIHEFSIRGFKEQLGADISKLLKKLEPKKLTKAEKQAEKERKHRVKHNVYN